MKVIDILKQAGFKFSLRQWPSISTRQLQALGITPTMLWAEFGKACLEQTSIGNRPRIGFMMTTINSARPLYLKNVPTKIGPCQLI